jgi:hypothetical protein
MKGTCFSGTTERVASIDLEIDRLLNLIISRLRRNEVVLAEEFAEELLEKAMKFLLQQKAARMNKVNRFLFVSMKLLLLLVFASLSCMVMNIQPLLGLKVFASGVIMIALLIVFNYYLFGRFCHAVQLMIETYKKESERFIDLLLDSARVNNNPETALNMFRLAMMR